MENNRTPGIWQYEKNLNHSIFVQTTNESNKGKVYITGYTSGEANAKFICKTANEYDKLKEERDLLIQALNPFINLAQTVFEDTKKSKEGVLYAFNKAEIKYSDLRRITELIITLKK